MEDDFTNGQPEKWNASEREDENCSFGLSEALEDAIKESEAALMVEREVTEASEAGEYKEEQGSDVEKPGENIDVEARMLSLVRQLDAEKGRLEKEMESLVRRLKNLGAPAHVEGHFHETHTPLVDPEGFPRADLSIEEILECRFRLEELKTTHKMTVNKLDQAMEAYFAAANNVNNSGKQ